MKMTFVALITTLTAASALAVSQPAITGDYLEVRSCDIFTGPCFANAEMGLTGKEAIMVWSVKEGSWQGTALDGLSVIAVVLSVMALVTSEWLTARTARAKTDDRR